jgi:hypothetical protein
MYSVQALAAAAVLLTAMAVAEPLHFPPRPAAKARAAGRVTAADVSYQYPRANATARTAQARLEDAVSVLDFGAVPRPGVDNTAAFNAALNADGEWPAAVRVPAGTYELNGTVILTRQRALVLDATASLVRPGCVADGPLGQQPPLVRLEGASATLRGDRSRVSSKCARMGLGLVLVGPPSEQRYDNVEWNAVQGITIAGSGPSHDAAWPSVGVSFRSSEPFVGGACYQNTLRDVVIHDVDVGVKAVKYVNANTFTNLQMGGITRYGMHFVNNSENQVHGLFVTGSRNITSVLRGDGSLYNSFSSIQAEPGGGQLFAFENGSSENSVIGHDNCPHGSAVTDDRFSMFSGGMVWIGNFSEPGSETYRLALNVRGPAFIQALDQGFAGVRTNAGAPGARDARRTEVAEDEPVFYSSTRNDTIVLCGVGLRERTAAAAAHYVVDVSGTQSEGGKHVVHVLSATLKVIVCPMMGAPALRVLDALNVELSLAGRCLRVQLPPVGGGAAGRREVVVDVRRAGAPLQPLTLD